MELKDMQLTWQNAGKAEKTADDLQKMLKLPALKRIRRRLILEGVCFLLVLAVYYDWFDGSQKPFYANLALVTVLISLITKDIIGYTALLKPAARVDIKTSVNQLLSRTVKLSRLSLAFSCLYSIALLTFFAGVIHFTREKYFILLGLIIIMVQIVFWSQRAWNRSIKNLREQIADLE